MKLDREMELLLHEGRTLATVFRAAGRGRAEGPVQEQPEEERDG
jgi:hypothetical protein